MAADWSLPGLTSLYTLVIDYLKGRDVDSATMCIDEPSNKPVGMMRYVRASDKLQEWSGTAWVDKTLSIAGGGTGGSTAVAARTSLGLGDMATQNSSAVSITGGSLAGNGSGLTTLNASNLVSGVAAVARLAASGSPSASTYLRGDSSWVPLVLDLPYGADQAASFTATVNTFYNLVGTSFVILPTVVGNGGKLIGFILKTVSIGWSIFPQGAETILGQNPFTFNWGQYSSIVLKADANNNKWDII